MLTVGLLYPGHSAEDDYPTYLARAGRPEVRLPLIHTSVGTDAHRVDDLLDLGSPQRLLAGARELAEQHQVAALMWACTSGSFVFGWSGAHQQVRELEEAIGLPTSSTSLAFVSACAALGIDRVAVAASYPSDVAELFAGFLDRGGVSVSAMGARDIVTAAEVGTLGREAVLALAASVDRSGAQAVLVPDTALHTLAWIPDLQAELGMPVLTANQVTIFEGLRLLGPVPPLPGLGDLFQEAALEPRS